MRWLRRGRVKEPIHELVLGVTLPRTYLLRAAEAARRLVEVASDRQAEDIRMLDVRNVVGYTDYVLVLSATSARHLSALAEELQLTMKREGVSIHHREGTNGEGWILLDYGDVIVHLFGEEQRLFYSIEKVWGQAREVLRVQ